MTRKLDSALGLYMEGIRDGNVREAVEKYTGDRYTQHSTGVGDGAEGFIAFFESFLERNPRRDIRVLRTVEEDRYVFCHATQDLNDGAARWVTMDLFDTDGNHKLVEHWDVIAPWSEDDAAGRSQVGGETEVRDLERTDANKALVRAFVTRVLMGGARADLDRFVAEDVVQHELAIADGAEAWREHLAKEQAADRPIVYREIFRLIGQGNFVVTYSKVDVGDVPHAVFDLFRVDGGRIVERWSNSEPATQEPGESAVSSNSGKF